MPGGAASTTTAPAVGGLQVTPRSNGRPARLACQVAPRRRGVRPPTRSRRGGHRRNSRGGRGRRDAPHARTAHGCGATVRANGPGGKEGRRPRQWGNHKPARHSTSRGGGRPRHRDGRRGWIASGWREGDGSGRRGRRHARHPNRGITRTKPRRVRTASVQPVSRGGDDARAAAAALPRIRRCACGMPKPAAASWAPQAPRSSATVTAPAHFCLSLTA